MICGDVSGHGPNAAALGAMLRVSWQALCAGGADPVVIVESLKSVLLRERRSPDTFATFCLAWIDPLRDEVRLLNVGHPVPLLIADEVRPLLATPMPPLGAVDWPVEQPQLVNLPEGWRLFFYTDGLIEGRGAPGSQERYGEDRLVTILQTLTGGPIDAERLEDLIAEVESAGGEPFSDDVTAIVISKMAAIPAVAAPTAASRD